MTMDLTNKKFSLYEHTLDLERRLLPELVAEREIRWILERNDPHAFWTALFRMILLSGGICKCGRPGKIRRIAGLSELISTCKHCCSFWVLLTGEDIPVSAISAYDEEPLATIDGWRVIQPLEVFVACGTAKLSTDEQTEEWLRGLLKEVVDHPYHRSKLIESILEKEIQINGE
jgi:hypothetical protein